MAIAFAGLALLMGLTLGFKSIDKPQQQGDTAIHELEKGEDGSGGEVQNREVEVNKTSDA
jgi:hypothetical protein